MTFGSCSIDQYDANSGVAVRRMSPPMSTFPDQFRLDGRTALVTGSARGLGWEMAKARAGGGARVLLQGGTQDRSAPRREELRRAGAACDALAFEMGDRAAMAAAIASAGPIDILIHNVGERDRRPFADIAPEDFARLVGVDLNAAHALVKLVVPGMIDRRWGRLILVTSIVADLAVPGAASYVAAKGGLAALTRALAAELQRERCPAKRWADPSEIAGAALFLASPAASYVNGHALVVDGGVSATYLA